MQGERKKHPFVPIDKVVSEEVSLEIPQVEKIFDVFDLSIPFYNEDNLNDIMKKPVENFESSLEQCSHAVERYQQLCDKQRKKLEN